LILFHCLGFGYPLAYLKAKEKDRDFMRLPVAHLMLQVVNSFPAKDDVNVVKAFEIVGGLFEWLLHCLGLLWMWNMFVSKAIGLKQTHQGRGGVAETVNFAKVNAQLANKNKKKK
jgi:hypothetical protein